MFKKILESRFLKGKLTYTGIGIFLIPVVGKLLGIELGEHDITPIIEGVGSVIAIIGRLRAAHQAG